VSVTNYYQKPVSQYGMPYPCRRGAADCLASGNEFGSFCYSSPFPAAPLPQLKSRATTCTAFCLAGDVDARALSNPRCGVPVRGE